MITVAMLLPSASALAVEPGAHAHLLWPDVDGAEARRQLDKLQSAGATVVRVDVGWASLQESGPNEFSQWHVDRLDHVVDEAALRGIKPILTLMESPCWASIAPESLKQDCAGRWWERGVQKYGPGDPNAYARIAAWVAARHGEKIAGIELWNEPNHPDFFKGDDRPGRYAALVRAAYPAIKAAAPSVPVVAGSLSEVDIPFYNQLMDRGLAGHYDAFAIHPYSHDASPADPRDAFSERVSFARGVPAFRAAQAARGDSKPLWLTESGWTTSTLRGEPWASGVDEATQARFLEEQADIVRRWDYVDVNIWFNLKDTGGGDQADMVGNYGLLREDGSEKPAFVAFRRAAAMLKGPRPSEPAAPAVSTPRPISEPLQLQVSRQTGNLVVSGTVPAGATRVTVQLHRKVGRRTKKNASYRVRLKAAGNGKKRTFRRKLPKRLTRKTWKVVAKTKVKGRKRTLRAAVTASRSRTFKARVATSKL